MLFELTFKSFGLKENVSGRRIGIKMGGSKKNILGISKATVVLTKLVSGSDRQ